MIEEISNVEWSKTFSNTEYILSNKLFKNLVVPNSLFKGNQIAKVKYFEKLSDIKKNYNISYDDLDKYFWVIGKIKSGNLSLLISNSDIYINDFIKNLNLTEEEKECNSKEFDKLVSNKLVLDEVSFQNPKLCLIKDIAKSIKNDGKVISI